MQLKKEQVKPYRIKLTISAEQNELTLAKQAAIHQLARQLKVPGFRPGKVPDNLAERNINPNTLQAETIDRIVNQLYEKAVNNERLRPVSQPEVAVQKFVPYSTLEFTLEVEVIGKILLPDYKKLHVPQKIAKVTAKDVDAVIKNLLYRGAQRKEIDRPAKEGDEVVMDFTGKDEATGQLVQGASSKGYPLVIGSNVFIPGFEKNLIGLKAGEQKSFTLTFPQDYGVAALKNRKVTFEVTINTVNELNEPKADDAFASKAGPFKTMLEMRDDIRKQLLAEKQREAEREFHNELVDKLAESTQVALPPVLIDEEVNREEQELRRNITYRGQTWQEYLDNLGKDEAAVRKDLRKSAERRLRGSLALTEIAEQEGIKVTPQEFQIRMQLLQEQYTDKAMQAELKKPENARLVLSNMLTEKTVSRLTEYVTKNAKSE